MPSLDEIRDQVKNNDLPVEVICDDILNADFNAAYDAAICMGNSFA